jgi:hypothetical protein
MPFAKIAEVRSPRMPAPGSAASLRCLLLALSVASLGCNGPFLLLPGGALSGEATPVPADWSFAGSAGTAQLETRGDAPYSVNIAYTVVGGALYINAGDTETQWVKNIAAEPNVRLRIDDALYDTRAGRVSDAAEIDAFAEAWSNQSFFRRDPRKLERVWIYRIVAR